MPYKDKDRKRESGRAWKERNKDKIREAGLKYRASERGQRTLRLWRAKNPAGAEEKEKQKARSRKCYLANRSAILQRTAEYARLHKGKYKETKKRACARWRANHPERVRERSRRREQRARDTLGDSYVKHQIARESGIPVGCVPIGLIPSKRSHLKLQRMQKAHGSSDSFLRMTAAAAQISKSKTT